MPAVTRTDQAEADLVDILHGVARHSLRAAERLRDEIGRTARLLARSPRLGRERADLLPGLFSRSVAGRYLLFYRPTDDGIEIARVLHGTRDIGPELFDG